jgi:hypothetical protein
LDEWDFWVPICTEKYLGTAAFLEMVKSIAVLVIDTLHYT